MNELKNVEIQKHFDSKDDQSSLWKTLLFVYSAFLLLDFAFFFATFATPPVKSKKTEFYKIDSIYHANQFDLILDIYPLTIYHRNILINASLHRNIDTIPISLPFSLNGTAFLINDEEELPILSIDEPNVNVEFDENSNQSYYFTLLNQSTKHIDFLRLNVSFIGNLLNIVGISVSYEYFNPQSYHLINSYRLFLFLVSLFSLFRYTIDYYQGNTNLINSLTIFVGFFTVLAPNITGILISSWNFNKYIDSYIQLLFFAFYRFYIFYLSIFLNRKSQKGIFPIMSFGFILVFIYSFLEFSLSLFKTRFSYAIVTNNSENNNEKGFFEYVLDLLHVTFSLFTLLVSILNLLTIEAKHKFTSVSYSCLIIFGSFMTLLSQFIFDKMKIFDNTVFPFVTYFNTHHLIATGFLFFQNSLSNSYSLLSAQDNNEDTKFDPIYEIDERLNEGENQSKF